MKKNYLEEIEIINQIKDYIRCKEKYYEDANALKELLKFIKKKAKKISIDYGEDDEQC